MQKPLEVQIALLSSMLVLRAHNAHAEGGLRYSAYIMDGSGTVISHHFATSQPFVRDNVLSMDSSEIRLHDGAAILVEDFLRRSFVFVNRPRQVGHTFSNEVRARA